MGMFLRALGILVDFIEILIIIRIFMNILRINTDNFFGKIITDLTEPILGPSRALLDKLGLRRGFIDFTPWIAILFLRIGYSFIVRLLG